MSEALAGKGGGPLANSNSNSSQTLLRLIKHLLPPSASEGLVSSHFASALQTLSNSASARHELRSEFAVAENIKKRLV